MNDNQFDEEYEDEPKISEERNDFQGTRVLSDWVKKAVATGVSAVFMTEEGVRSALSEIKMPKDAIGSIVSQVDKTKTELIAAMARELRGFLNNLEIHELIKKVLAGTTFEINAKIRLVPGKYGALKVELVGDEPEKKAPRSTRTKAKAKPKRKTTRAK